MVARLRGKGPRAPAVRTIAGNAVALPNRFRWSTASKLVQYLAWRYHVVEQRSRKMSTSMEA